jgi:hypothetical protein
LQRPVLSTNDAPADLLVDALNPPALLALVLLALLVLLLLHVASASAEQRAAAAVGVVDLVDEHPQPRPQLVELAGYLCRCSAGLIAEGVDD